MATLRICFILSIIISPTLTFPLQPTSCLNTLAAPNISSNNSLTLPNLTQPSFYFPNQARWGLNDISTVVFGCVASILGVLALLMTIWLGRRRASFLHGAGLSNMLDSMSRWPIFD